MHAPIHCWVLSDGRRGIENQALGLAQALSRLHDTDITRHVLTSRGMFKSLPSRVQSALQRQPKNYGLNAPYPQIAIGCGRQAIAPLLALKKTLGNHIFTVYVQNPRINPKNFDLVIAPEHDNIHGPNVKTMIGSPNRITQDLLKSEALKFSKQLKVLPRPRAVFLLGGTSKTHKFTPIIHAQHMETITQLLELGGSIMITASRRTPEWVRADYQKLDNKHPQVWYWDSISEQNHDNPYFAFIGSADMVFVTEDSTNMLTEACASGKPVYALPMAGNAKKFKHLYAALKTRCHLKPFSGVIENHTYGPLDETARMAKLLLTRFQKT